MSRIGKQPVTIPAKVDVQINGDHVKVKGPKGELERTFRGVKFETEDGSIRVDPAGPTREHRALWGTARALLANMVHGVSSGFTRVLEIRGVGYRCEQNGNNLVLSLGTAALRLRGASQMLAGGRSASRRGLARVRDAVTAGEDLEHQALVHVPGAARGRLNGARSWGARNDGR